MAPPQHVVARARHRRARAPEEREKALTGTVAEVRAPRWVLDPPPDLPAGAIDPPKRGRAVAGATLTVQGWALGAPGAHLAKVEMRVDAQPAGLARTGFARKRPPLPDHPDAALCGFLFELQTEPGRSSVRVGATAELLDGTRFDLGERAIDLAQPLPASSPPRPWRARRAARPDPRRLLAVSQYLGYGGSETYLCELLVRLAAEHDLEVTVASFDPGPLRARYQQAGIEVVETGAFPEADAALYEQRMRAFGRWVRGRRFGAVVANSITSYPAVDAALRLGLPAIFAIHESVEVPQWPSGRWHHRAHPYVAGRAAAAIRGAGAVLFEAEATRLQYLASGDPDRLLTMPYGLELGPIDEHRRRRSREADRAALGIAPGDTALLALGTVQGRKYQGPMAQVVSGLAAAHPGLRLFLVGAGHGQEADGLAAWLERNRGEVAGSVDLLPHDGDPWRWHNAADLYVCASDIESLPRSIMEAMAFDVPVLSSDVFGVPELIEDGRTGWLCRTRDMRSFAARLDEVLHTSPEARRAIGEAGGRRVRERHDPARYAGAFRDLVTQLQAR